MLLQAVGLHGRSQTGEVFRTRVEKLVQATNAEFEWSFPDAPIAITSGDREQVKSWYEGGRGKLTWDALPSINSPSPPQVLVGFSQGGLIAIANALKLESVRLVIVAGVPLDEGDWLDAFLQRTSVGGPTRELEVHFFVGSTDEVVPMRATRAVHDKLAKVRGVKCFWEEFEGKHQFPNSSKYLQKFTALLALQMDVCGSVECAEQQREELTVLESIYGEQDMRVLRGAPQRASDVGLQVEIQVTPTLALKCTPKFGYPLLPGSRLGLQLVSSEAKLPKSWLQRVISAEQDLQGEQRIFACVAALQEAMLLNDNAQGEDAETETAGNAVAVMEEETEAQLFARVERCTLLARERIKTERRTKAEEVEDDTRRGEWKLCIGLLGKPSAGKSSFFNACTAHTAELGLAKLNQAEVGAQPFTTIDPHFGLATCQYEPDFQATVVIKDVAGLVPGAYRGLGKGNRFLNDLLDSTALLHICDGSGASDDGGNIAQLELNPKQVSRDALWVLREVHLWIYGNISTKWPANAKKGAEQNATRVCQLFAGYHAPPCLVTRAARLAQLDLNQASSFTNEQRHLLVACFIAIRFPVVLVLNKFDEVRHDAVRAQEIYNAAVKVMGNAPDLVQQASAKLETQRLLSDQGATALTEQDTGVSQALYKAIRIANPLVVTAVLGTRRHKFFFHPNSQVYDLYQCCSRKRLLAGDFVRAESASLGTSKALGRDTYLRDYSEVKIITNRKI